MKASLGNLLEKYNKGIASNEEIALLHAYYEQLEEEESPLLTMTSAESVELKNELKGGIDWEIDNSSKLRVIEKKGMGSTWIRSAAAVLLLLVMGWIYKRNDNNLQLTAKEKKNSVAAAERTIFQLPDSSTVILEAGSSLEYPEKFKQGAPRMVRLNGAAFFDITHRTGSSFLIESGKMKITVLGTAFHVRAWPSEKENSVIVTRGKVKVEANNKILGYLLPAEKLRFNKTAVVPQRSTIESGIAIKDQEELPLKNVTLKQAFKLIETLYAVKINIDASIDSSRRFSGTIIKGESLQEVMNRIAAFEKISYDLNDDEKTLSIRLLAN